MSKHSCAGRIAPRSEEHTSELQSLYTISYAVFCLKKKKDLDALVGTDELERLLERQPGWFFFFNDPATTEIYTVYNTLSLHDALPISIAPSALREAPDLTLLGPAERWILSRAAATRSEEHTSELQSLYTISYAVFCLKKKKKKKQKKKKKNYNTKKHKI